MNERTVHPETAGHIARHQLATHSGLQPVNQGQKPATQASFLYLVTPAMYEASTNKQALGNIYGGNALFLAPRSLTL